ncbi:hypothetical protein [Streptomyces europaeiscabiei]|nr:hypothetical protein [Streptomyces europaeiscabiei]MDX2529360.1 hypothetical protein [Streptomyces europaeiscabiei]
MNEQLPPLVGATAPPPGVDQRTARGPDTHDAGGTQLTNFARKAP